MENLQRAAVPEFEPEVIEAQKRISAAFPHMTKNQISYLTGYLDAMASRKEEAERQERAAG